MAWIESHQSLSTHRKTLRAVAALRVDRHKFLGHLHELWWWGLDNVPADGHLGDLSDREIAEAAGWKRDPAGFIKAITDAGFVDLHDDGRYLHDWFDYAGKYLTKRAKNRERMRQQRGATERTSGARADDAAISNEDTCAPRARHVQRTSGARAGATYQPTVEDRTEPTYQPDSRDSYSQERESEFVRPPARGVASPDEGAERSAVFRHPAVQAHADLAGGQVRLTPPQAAVIANAIGRSPEELARWRAVVEGWLSDGFKAGNVNGQVDRYRKTAPREAGPPSSAAPTATPDLGPRCDRCERRAERAKEAARLQIRQTLRGARGPLAAALNGAIHPSPAA